MFFWVYFLLLVIETLIGLILISLNRSYMRKNGTTPSGTVTTYLSKEEINSAVRYNTARMHLSNINIFIQFFVVLVAVLLKIPGFFEQIAARYSDNQVITGTFTVFLTSVLFFIPGLFTSYYSQFVIEERHGFNTMTPGLFFIDTLKSVILGAVIGIPVLSLLILTIHWAGSFWWLLGAVITASVQIFLLFIFPVLLAPLFYKFTPLEDGELKTRIKKLSLKTGFSISAIFVIDGSRRSRHGNAFFTGFGSTKRIALFDTLLDTLDINQIEAVVAHELGHARLGHIRKQIFTGLSVLFAGFFVLSLLVRYAPIYDLFGLREGTIYGLLTFVLYFASPFTFVFTPVSSFFSRKREYEADNYAYKYSTDKSALADGLVKLHKDNKTNPFPHPLYSFFNYSHPPVWDRLKALELLIDKDKN